MSDSRWSRAALLAALVFLGVGYIGAFALFLTRSRDFVMAQHNRRAMERAIAAPVEVPGTVQLTAGSAGVALLGGGWYASEPPGTWSSMNDSWIALDVRDAGTGIGVTLSGTAAVGHHHKKILVSAEVAAHELGAWERTQRNASEPLRFCIPPAISRTRRVMLHLHVDSLASPADMRTGPDLRKLGVLLATIQLSAGCESVPQESATH
jgi:hypothetical protein